MVVHSFDSARMKLGRSQMHLDALIPLHNAWITEHSLWTTESEQEADGVWVMRVADVPDVPREWGLIVGDLIHNARCALDHLVCALVARNGGQITRSTQFPIYDHQPNAREQKRIEGNLKG